MIVERNFARFVVFAEDSLLSALGKISDNQTRLIFAVAESGILEGVLTDGDFRRWVTATDKLDLSIPVARVINRQCRFARMDDDPERLQSMLSPPITAVPLVDANHRLVAVALPRTQECRIGDRLLGPDEPAFVIAEIGNNHNGSLELACHLIDEAVRAGADCAKFQMRSMDELYGGNGSGNASADLGAQYTLDLLERFQLSDDDLFAAFDHCKARGIIPLCTPWDLTSLAKLESYGMAAYKIASADFTNHDLISAVAATWKPFICSTGMATEREIRDGIRHIRQTGTPFVLLHCNSTYPAPFRDVNLRYMQQLAELGDCLVGYSGHERDVNVAIAAVSLGAKVIEKHLTLDRDMEGNDHKVSLLPDEFAVMVNGIRQVEQALGGTGERRMTQGEMMNRENLAKSLVARVDIDVGTIITEEMIVVRSPGQGLQPYRKKELLGRVLHSTKKAGECFFESDLGVGVVTARDYAFGRRWGVPVRYHDLDEMRRQSNMELVEIHLSYKDMELDFRQYVPQPLDLELVVHSPELFAGDHTLDLCALDESYRRRSVEEMQRVIDLTRALSQYFDTGHDTLIVTNVGGFSQDRHLGPDERARLYEILERSLSELDRDGVELIPQTMPPFPWHFGGQRFHNLFLDPDGIVEFCERNGMRVCLDTSHSKLACNHAGWSFAQFVASVGPHTAHMHLADAAGVDGEGLQIGEGEIDWRDFWATADRHAAGATFIPEIWQGHKNGGAGAWLGLERLESYQSD